MKESRYCFALIMFLIGNLIVQPIIWGLPEDDSIKDTECFDRYKNKIHGLVCEEKSYGVPFEFKLIMSVFIILFTFILSYVQFGGSVSK